MNFKIFIKFKLLLLSLFFIGSLSADYLFFVRDNGQIRAMTREEYEEVYILRMKYEYPMSSINPDLTDSEKSILFGDSGVEADNFIREKIQEINSKFDLVFIPGIIFEIVLIYYWFVRSDLFESEDNVCISDLITTFLISDYDSDEDRLKAFKENNMKILLNCENRNVSSFVNGKMFSFLFSRTLNVSSDNPKPEMLNDIGRRISLFVGEYVNHFEQWIKHSKYPLKWFNETAFAKVRKKVGYSNFTRLVVRLCQKEYKYHVKNKFLLYRSVQDFLDPESKINEKIFLTNGGLNRTRTISLGNSIFAGINEYYFLDVCACVFYRFKSEDSKIKFKVRKTNLYVLPVEKKLFEEQKMFLISPLSLVAGFQASGEFFHSRTRVDTEANLTGIILHPKTKRSNLKTLLGTDTKMNLIENYIAKHADVISL